MTANRLAIWDRELPVLAPWVVACRARISNKVHSGHMNDGLYRPEWTVIYESVSSLRQINHLAIPPMLIAAGDRKKEDTNAS
jgi:hypothetical protein